MGSPLGKPSEPKPGLVTRLQGRSFCGSNARIRGGAAYKKSARVFFL